MGHHDPNLGLSAFAVVIGAAVGLAVALALGFGALGILVAVVVGVLGAGLAASLLGIVSERDRGPRDELPPEYDDY